MDTDNAPDIVIADGLAPPGEPLPPPPRVRWRQRGVGPGRAAPAPTPGAARALVTLRPSSRASDRGAGPPDTSPRPPPEHPPSARPGHALDHAGPSSEAGEPRVAVHAGSTDDTDALPATGGVRDAAGASRLARPPSARQAGDGGGAARHIDPASAPAPAPEPGSAPSDEPEDASGAASPAPQRAPREADLWLLARRAQGAALNLDFELRTALARQVFRRDFVYVSRQLHALEASRRVQGLDRTRLNDALAALRQRADEIQAFLAQRRAELQAAVAARGPAGAHVAFARPARFQAAIVSPGAHRFLGLVMLADDTLAVLEMAWLLGLVEPATRAALVSDCRRALIGFKELACELRHAVGMLVQEINAQRRDGHAAPSGD